MGHIALLYLANVFSLITSKGRKNPFQGKDNINYAVCRTIHCPTHCTIANNCKLSTELIFTKRSQST